MKKIIIIGSRKVGKTSLISSFLNEEIMNKEDDDKDEDKINIYEDVDKLYLECNHNDGINNYHFYRASIAIIMFDCTYYNKEDIYNCYKDIRRINDNIKIIILGNKYDKVKDKKDIYELVLYLNKLSSVKVYIISLETKYNIEPFLKYFYKLCS